MVGRAEGPLGDDGRDFAGQAGDGVYLEANYVDREISITISGAETQIQGLQTNTQAVRLFPIGPNYAHAQIEITGGVYNTDVAEYLMEGYICKLQDGKYVVTKEEAAE